VRLPPLKLAHKGLLIVILPVIMQLFLYVELKKEIDAVQRQAAAQEYSRDVMIHVNSLILECSKMFEAYVNLWTIKSEALQKRAKQLEVRVAGELDALHSLLLTHKEDYAVAQAIRERGDNFLRAMSSVTLTLEEKGKPETMFDALEMHQDFGETSRRLMAALQELGAEHGSRVKTAGTVEADARRQLLLFCDIAVGLTLLMAVGLAMYFVKGTVRSLQILQENTHRLAANEQLLPPIKGDDEIASVDQQFRAMADKLKEATAQLDESYKRLQSVIDTVPMAIVIADESGGVESLNQAGSALFGWGVDEIQGKPVTVFFPKAPSLQKWVEDTRERPVQSEAISKEQEAVPVELSVLRFQSPRGVRLLLAVMDITERYKMERMKRDFIAMVSHDIRSPLTSISACMDLIKQQQLAAQDTVVSEWVNTAQGSADRLLSMVTKLLDLERLDSGIFNFDLTEFTVNDAIEAAWNATRSPARNVAAVLPEEQFSVFADRESVEHVVQNFFSNAIKFSPDDGLITCRIEHDEQPGMVRICVSDQGPGIPERYLQTVFERFKQAPQGRKRKDGTGLGLAICKSMVEAMGGEIGVQNNPGGGSTFWFTIPSAVRDEASRVKAVANVSERAD
jgi:PAS domain S-box-containing protein